MAVIEAALTGLSGQHTVGGSGYSLTNQEEFQRLMSTSSANTSPSGFTQMVQAAENRQENSMQQVKGILKDFNDNPQNVAKLIEATHLSAMNSVAVQLTGKVSTKSAESVEQLYKQQ